MFFKNYAPPTKKILQRYRVCGEVFPSLDATHQTEDFFIKKDYSIKILFCLVSNANELKQNIPQATGSTYFCY